MRKLSLWVSGVRGFERLVISLLNLERREDSRVYAPGLMFSNSRRVL